MSRKKVHLGCNCYPYKRAWHVFCKKDFVEENDYDKWLLTEDVNEVTCKRCLKEDARLQKEMIESGLLNPDGSLNLDEEDKKWDF